MTITPLLIRHHLSLSTFHQHHQSDWPLMSSQFHVPCSCPPLMHAPVCPPQSWTLAAPVPAFLVACVQCPLWHAEALWWLPCCLAGEPSPLLPPPSRGRAASLSASCQAAGSRAVLSMPCAGTAATSAPAAWANLPSSGYLAPANQLTRLGVPCFLLQYLFVCGLLSDSVAWISASAA